MRTTFFTPSRAVALLLAVLAYTADGCVPPPPNVSGVPASGLALRVHIFGASATDVNDAFLAAHKNTPAFTSVNDGGDGDVVIGLENDSPMCVPPTGLCSFKVSYRVRNNAGDPVTSSTQTITAQADHCGGLCSQAINNVVVKVLQDASSALAGGATEDSASKLSAKGRPTAAKGPPPMCSIAAGPRLPSGEAAARAAQVEVLKRIGVIDQNEYDCLRKAYLTRL